MEIVTEEAISIVIELICCSIAILSILTMSSVVGVLHVIGGLL